MNEHIDMKISGSSTMPGGEYGSVSISGAGKVQGSLKCEEMHCSGAASVQGVVDCAFRTEEGLVVVDFKTDRLAPGEEPQRAEEYRPQLEAYAQALERVMEEKVCRKVLYFFSTGATINL